MSKAMSAGFNLSAAMLWMAIAVLQAASGAHGLLVLVSAALSITNCFLAANTLAPHADAHAD